MDVTAAIAEAKDQIQRLFADEGIKNVGLEGVEYDESKAVWMITIGFSRPWSEMPRVDIPSHLLDNPFNWKRTDWQRDYKVVHISNGDGRFLSVKPFDGPT